MFESPPLRAAATAQEVGKPQEVINKFGQVITTPYVSPFHHNPSGPIDPEKRKIMIACRIFVVIIVLIGVAAIVFSPGSL